MKKSAKMKLKISKTVEEKLREVHEELIKRGATNFDVSELLEQVIMLPDTQKVIDQFLTLKSPEDYKIRELLNTPGEREKVLALLNNKNFGLAPNGSVHGTENPAQL